MPGAPALHRSFSGRRGVGPETGSVPHVPRVYIHEVVEVDGTRRAHYQHHMTANWVPEAGPLRRQRLFGVFSLVGSTGEWPRVVNMWEYDSWDDLAHNFSVELAGGRDRDPMLERWWNEAAAFRRGGSDRVLVAHEESPGVQSWEARGGTRSVGYLHDLITVAPGAAPAICQDVFETATVSMAAFGIQLVGLWRTAMRADDQIVAIWGLPDWPAWAALEEAMDGGSGYQPEAPLARERTLLVDAELSPLRIGRQPAESDRRSFDEV